MSSLLQTFYQKLDFLYLKFAASKDSRHTLHCELCDSKIENHWDDNHRLSQVHCAAVNHITEQLINVFFSHNIILRNGITNGFCFLCNENLTLFSNELDHLNSSNHLEKMEASKIKHEDKFSAVYKAFRICANDYEDALVKKVIGNGIKVEEDGKYHCIPCNIEITDEKQFCTHITGSAHLEWVINQLFLAAAVILRLHEGFTIKNGSFFCMICKTVIGSGLAAAKEISAHVNSSCGADSIEDTLSSDSYSSSSDSYSSDEDDNCDSTQGTNFRRYRYFCHSSCEECELDLSWSDNEWEDICNDD